VSDVVAIVLGVVQGVFMFVPVSSTSHLALVQHMLLGRGAQMPEPDSAQMILFDLVLHVGTLVSITIVMRRPLANLVTGVVSDIGNWRRHGTLAGAGALRMCALLALATVVTGALGLIVRLLAPAVFGTPVVIATMLVITGFILRWTDRALPIGNVTPTMVAVGVGAVQALALLPGLSRSGLTIAAALAFGLARPQAAEFSFVLAIPTILAATVVQSFDVLGEPIDIPLSAMALGFVVSAVVGTVALKAVLRLLAAARFGIFSIYVWLLAAVVLGVALTGADVF
jgi:undecaprenyl-diphosphatase